MIKCALTITLLLTAGATTGIANIFTVDFASLGTESFDITASTTGGQGYTLGNVTFLYDDFSDPTANGTAAISAGGIDGSGGDSHLAGNLQFLFNAAFQATLNATPPSGIFTFGAPISGKLTFNFTVGTDTGVLKVKDGAYTALDNALTDSVTAPTTTKTGVGTVLFPGSTAPFHEASTYFSSNSTATNFNVSALSFNVPEPAGIFLPIGTVLLGLGFASRLSKRRS